MATSPMLVNDSVDTKHPVGGNIGNDGQNVDTKGRDGATFGRGSPTCEILIDDDAAIDEGENEGFVYFVECDDFIKIGYTESVEDRVRALATATPYPLTVLATINGSQNTESCLHSRFADARHKGEWFRKTPELLDYIESAKEPSAREAA
jgi:hypothetical protein